MDTTDRTSELDGLVEAMLQSYRADPRGQFINKRFIPSRDEIIAIVRLLLAVFYPGYHGRQDLTDDNVRYHVGSVLMALREKLERQVELCLCHGEESGEGHRPNVPRCANYSKGVARTFLQRLPEIRARLIEDVQAAWDGDPAATSLDEVILAYPGLLAVTVYRIAHELHALKVPLMPRIMTEWAHTQTGADIHPGAQIAPRFFIDHATGVVVGETSHIGAGVKLYQGVTLGARSHPRDEGGRLIRGAKRHPTVEDEVTIYANATVLGGETVVGRGSLVGGSVFLTRTVPPGTQVALEAPKLRIAPSASAPAPLPSDPPQPGPVEL